MQRIIKSAFILFVVLGLVVVVTVPVFAKSDPTPSATALRDPIVSPMKATDTYTSTVVEVGYLKGALQKEDQSMAPVGRTDEQFGSNAVVVSDLTGKEKVKACFYFSGYNYKWAGNIYRWSGTQWVKQVTTITNDPEGTPMACASGLGNGTYALIIYYWGPQEMSFPATPPPF
ncbi:MAG: hypothetical protein FP831_16355 [Anaerolineae bacterium]|nr:hypothetical protein [Anaerolineae bacterium]